MVHSLPLQTVTLAKDGAVVAKSAANKTLVRIPQSLLDELADYIADEHEGSDNQENLMGALIGGFYRLA
jgi:hypothetical protein